MRGKFRRSGQWRSWRKIAFCSVALLLGATTPAFAYIDPGSSGLLFQIITPLVVLWLAGVRSLRRTIVTFSRRVYYNITGRHDVPPSDSTG